MTVSTDFVESIKALIKEQHRKESQTVDYQYEKLAGLLEEWQNSIELDKELGVFHCEPRR